RQRKSSNGNYQVDEDVWARHPNDGVMYIASIIAINNYHRTCRVTFIDDDQTFDLPVSHLRHVTREDIRCNRYVDYGQGWAEYTSAGTINTYDRYGEPQQTQFTGRRHDIFHCSLTAVQSNCSENDTIHPTTSIQQLVPLHLEELDSPQLPETLSQTELHVLESGLQSPSVELYPSKTRSLSDVAKQQLLAENIKIMLSYYEENNIQLPEPLTIMKNEMFQTSCPFGTQYNTSINNPSLELLDQQVLLDNVQDEKHEPSISSMDPQYFVNAKEIGTQTETFISVPEPIIDSDPGQKPIVMTHSNQLTKYSHTPAIDTTKKNQYIMRLI
ncbi:unnamed protein product, partial [Rotaria sp. Silwood1]